jgi:hypothetical protein
MTEQTKVAPNLTGGVSQQPMGVRSPNQLSECLNAHLSQVDGNAKRPPTKHIAKLVADLPDDAEYHVVERDGRDYVVVMTSTAADSNDIGMRVFDAVDGSELTIVPNALATEVDQGYNGNSPGNHVIDWELVGLSDRWTTAVGVNEANATKVTVTGPVMSNWDTPTAVVTMGSETGVLATAGVWTTDVYTKFTDRVTYVSGYFKLNNDLEHIYLAIRNHTKGLFYRAYLGWVGTTLVAANGQQGELNDDQPGEIVIEAVGDDWYRATYFIDLAEADPEGGLWPEAGDLINSIQIQLLDGTVTDGDYVYGMAVGHIDGDVPTAAPPIENSFGPFRFITIADATFVLNTSWPTVMTRDGSATRDAWLAGITTVVESKMTLGVSQYQQNTNYDWSITNSFSLTPITGTVKSGSHSSNGTNPTLIQPAGTKNLAKALATSIDDSSFTLTAQWDGYKGVLIQSQNYEATAFTATAALMTTSLTAEADTLYIVALEKPLVTQDFIWSITNDEETHTNYVFGGPNDTIVNIASTDTTAQMATKLAAGINTHPDQTTLTAVATGEFVVVTSTSPITAFDLYAQVEQEGGANEDDAYSHFSIARESVTDVAYISVIQGVADSEYTWELTTSAGTFSGAHTIAVSGDPTDTRAIASALAVLIADADITLEGTSSFGSVVEVRSTVTIADFKTNDTQAENLMVPFHTEVETIADLPLFFRNGFIVKISTDPTTGIEDQFVKFQTTSGLEGFGLGQWLESTDWGESKYLAESSMPHKLQLLYDNADGDLTGTAYEPYFEYGPQEWTRRLVGNDVTNPPPSFVGGKLTDVHFSANRLGFLEDQNVVQSETGVYFNFWRTTSLAIPDTDPIDVSVNEPEVAILHTAATLGEQLIVTSSAGQFVLEGSPPTPATAFLRKVTAYRFANLRPAPSGRSLYYSVPGAQASTIVEFSRVTEGFTTDEVTRASPAYVAGPVEFIKALPAANFLLAKAEADNILYAYKYDWRGDQKSQSAWSKWTWPSTAVVKHIDFIESRAIILFKHEDDLYLETFDLGDALSDGANTYQVHLDRRRDQDQCSAVYSAPNTTITWTDAFPAGTVPALTDVAGAELTPVSTDVDEIVVAGDYSATDFFVGVKYNHIITLSAPLPQTQDRLTGALYPKQGKFSVVTLHVQVAETGFFTSTVAPRCVTSTYVQTFDYTELCDATDLLEGYHQVSVMSDADDLVVTLESDSPLPSRFTAAIWKGDVAPRGIL